MLIDAGTGLGTLSPEAMARIGHGHHGGILMSHEIWAHVQDMVDVEERGTIQMKGIARDVSTYAVKGRKVSGEALLDHQCPEQLTPCRTER